MTLFGLAVQQRALSALVPGNPNPAYHLIQIVGLDILSRSALLMDDRFLGPDGVADGQVARGQSGRG